MLPYVLDKLPYVGRLRKYIKHLGEYPAGHYYSPIPNRDDILVNLQSTKTDTVQLPDVDLNTDRQFEVLNRFQTFYHDLPFSENRDRQCRFYYDQNFFSYADAIFLYSFLRHTQPKRIIEVGSGFSSAVILDTAERFLPSPPEITLIDPDPRRLKKLLRRHDKKRIQIIKKRVQDVPIPAFTALSAGDLLFIDSSHILKCGSDVHFLIFNILPRLPGGIFVHFHDVFYPFEYPAEWLLEGRYWNESYFLRAFLSHNSEWTIYFFSTYISRVFRDFLKNEMPLCLKNIGGSLYIQRR